MVDVVDVVDDSGAVVVVDVDVGLEVGGGGVVLCVLIVTVHGWAPAAKLTAMKYVKVQSDTAGPNA